MLKLADLIRDGVHRLPPKLFLTDEGDAINRKEMVTASAIGYCRRMQYFRMRHGVETDELSPNWGVFRRGDYAEMHIVEALRNAYTEAKFYFLGEGQRSFRIGKYSGTPDGVMEYKGKYYLLEFKSIDPRTNTKYLPKKEHVDQVMYNMALIRCHHSEWNITEAIILYVDVSNYDNMWEHYVTYSEEAEDKLFDKADEILHATSAAELRPDGVFDRGCDYCEFKGPCNAVNATTAQKDGKRDTAKRVFG